MSSSPFKHLTFDKATCRKELNEYLTLLGSKAERGENEDILPFFRSREHLTALMGSFNGAALTYDRLKQEMPLWSNFRTDFAIGDSTTLSYTLVEFEGAKANSVFNNASSNHISPYAQDFAEGYFQLVDWFWRLDDFRSSEDFKRLFSLHKPVPDEEFSLVGVLVVGRDQFVEESDRQRLSWLRTKVPINANPVHVITFDRLYRLLDRRLTAIGG